MFGNANPKFMLNDALDRRFPFLRALLATALLALIAFPCHGQPFQPVPDRAESVTRSAGAGDEASPYKPRRASASPPAQSISIGPVSEDRLAAETGAARRPGTPHKIGFGRDVPQLRSAADTAARLQWQITPQGGKIAAISITSPKATGIRLGVLVRSLPPEAVLRFYPQGAGAAYEISGREVLESIKRNLDAGDSSDEARTYWSPHVEGEEETLEIELPVGIGPDALEIAIPRVSHFFDSPLAAKGGYATKAAASCEVDVSCYPDWSPESKATAKMVFVKSSSSYLCSGTLLNDTTSSGTPHFLSADHCISTQTVASTLETHWFYRSSGCNLSSVDPAYKVLAAGATLLYAGTATDTSFMRLNNPPPAGAISAGWSASAPSLGTSATGVHHPDGDFQKIGFGSVQSFLDCTPSDPFSCSNASQANGEYLSVVFTSGITEGGSSGSGLFMSSGGSHILIGQLRGGHSSCSDPSGADRYGRFDIAYNTALHQWLNSGSTFSLSVTKSGNGRGTVASSPAGIDCGTICSAPFANGSGVTLAATPAPGSIFSGWSGACSGSGASCSLGMDAARSVTATFAVDTIALGVALDNTSLAWSSGGNAPFAPQTATSFFGGSAVQTGAIGNDQSSYLSTSVTGPGTLSWYWNVSSESGYDFFRVYLDGISQSQWSGQGAWKLTTLEIPPGRHTVKWEYAKDGSVASGQDAGWIDQVVFTGLVSPQTGVWWNPAENGRGFYIEENAGGAIFFGSYLYEPMGRATWYSSALNPSAGSFSGTLDSHHGGQTLTGAYAAPSTTMGAGGNVSLAFTDPTHGTINWAGGTTPIQRFAFADNSNPPSFQPQSGAWWNPAESGRGFALEVNGSTVFLGGYMYDAAGNPIWYLSTGTLTGQTYQGDWTEYASGQSLGGPYVAPTLVNSAVGQVSITFSSPTDGVMTLPNGATIPITRFLF